MKNHQKGAYEEVIPTSQILSKLELERLILLVLHSHFVHITSRINKNCNRIFPYFWSKWVRTWRFCVCIATPLIFSYLAYQILWICILKTSVSTHCVGFHWHCLCEIIPINIHRICYKAKKLEERLIGIFLCIKVACWYSLESSIQMSARKMYLKVKNRTLFGLGIFYISINLVDIV